MRLQLALRLEHIGGVDFLSESRDGQSIKCQSLLDRAAYGQITLTTKLSGVNSGHFGCEN